MRLDKRFMLVLAAWDYINELIKACPYLQESDITTVQIPYNQIMGFKVVLSVFRIRDKGVYTTEDLMKFSFPTTKKQLRQGSVTDNKGFIP